MNRKHQVGFALLWGLLLAGLLVAALAIGLTMFWERVGGPDGVAIADGINFFIYLAYAGLFGFCVGAWLGWSQCRWPKVPWIAIIILFLAAAASIPARSWAERQWDQCFQLLINDDVY